MRGKQQLWVEGDALVTALALHGNDPHAFIQVGDEVKLKTSTMDTHIDEEKFNSDNRKWVVISIDNDVRHPINLARRMSKPDRWTQCCALHHLRAWRRPLKKETT